MSHIDFLSLLQSEVTRLDSLGITKREENVIQGFTDDPSPRAKIAAKKYLIFNSNDYLGLRFYDQLKTAESKASQLFGTGPGAVRFISGSLQIHRDLEKALARFHGRDDAIIFSSAFAANLAIISSLIKGQSKDSLLDADTLVVSDQLNHRSIVDGIRVANLPSENKLIYPHLDVMDLDRILRESVGKFTRVLVITDGVFSMLGEIAPLSDIRDVITKHDSEYSQGITLLVDDCHGIGTIGPTGRGTEEYTSVQADVLVGTLGKAFGADGGYVVADQNTINYLRESAATYIYSNSISPGTAGAALAAVRLVNSVSGKKILRQLTANIELFRSLMQNSSVKFAAPSVHPIQPVLIGDSQKSKQLQKALFTKGILVTGINYPIVPKGRDEIRIQISASHTPSDLTYLTKQLQTLYN